MAASTKVWVNNQAPQCEDVDLNGFKNENNNAIVAAGLSLNTGDNEQTGQAMTIHTAGSDFYTATGTDTYVLTPVAIGVGFQGPAAYFNGMRVRTFIGNANTAASTVNVAGLGAKNVFNIGAAVVGGVLVDNVELVFDSSNDRFNLIRSGDDGGGQRGLDIDGLVGLDIILAKTDSTEIGQGTARNLGNSVDLVVGSGGLQKFLGSPWQSGSGGASNGLPTAVTTAVDDDLHFFIFTDTTRAGIEGGWDNDTDANNLLAEATSVTGLIYDAGDIRRIHSSTVDVVDELRPMLQEGNDFYIAEDTQPDLQGFGDLSWNSVTFTMIPSGLNHMRAYCITSLGDGAPADTHMTLKSRLVGATVNLVTQDIMITSYTGNTPGSGSTTVKGGGQQSSFLVNTGASAQFIVAVVAAGSTSNDQFFMSILGYTDTRSTL